MVKRADVWPHSQPATTTNERFATDTHTHRRRWICIFIAPVVQDRNVKRADRGKYESKLLRWWRRHVRTKKQNHRRRHRRPSYTLQSFCVRWLPRQKCSALFADIAYCGYCTFWWFCDRIAGEITKIINFCVHSPLFRTSWCIRAHLTLHLKTIINSHNEPKKKNKKTLAFFLRRLCVHVKLWI